MSEKFRYPVGNGTREDFEKRFYVALEYGSKQIYGYHEGVDINLKTGGDSDLGEPIYAIADWDRKYFHLKSHLTSGFGEHYVYEVKSPWGTRWIHCAHNQKSINFEVRESGLKGEKLSEIDKTGRPRLILPAHLHITVFRKDPTGLQNGIDSIATSQSQLLENWEDPIEFFKNWYDYKDEEIDMDIKELIETGYLVFTGQKPNKDELAQRIKDWTTTKAFLESITGDSRFYGKYIQPQLDSQKTAQESACNTDKTQINTDWQSKFDTANREWDKKYKILELKKVQNLPPSEVIMIGLRKLFAFLRPKRG